MNLTLNLAIQNLRSIPENANRLENVNTLTGTAFF